MCDLCGFPPCPRCHDPHGHVPESYAAAYCRLTGEQSPPLVTPELLAETRTYLGNATGLHAPDEFYEALGVASPDWD